MNVIGLMSGTSADGVDAALVEWPDTGQPRPFVLLAFHHAPFPPDLQERIHRLAAGELAASDTLAELVTLDVILGERFAEAALAVAQKAQLPLEEVRAIASHGQTVAHHPECGGSLQIGDPSRIAERTGITTVADFRARDLAAGGEGAPLTPFFHWVAFTSETENRLILNLGGIANVTWLPAAAAAGDVIAFDVGPANALLDGVICTLTQGRERMDRAGQRARRGQVDAKLLEALLDDDYLRRRPPKSTGRERYGSAEARALVKSWNQAGRNPDDLLATLVVFGAEAVGRACDDFLLGRVEVARLLLGGGGADNPAYLSALAAVFPGAAIDSFDYHGVPARAAEAVAFALLGRNALLGLPNHLPCCTGAARSAVLGEVVPGRDGFPRL